ncbi:MAG TPA: hypothetical protein VK918_06635 [Pyrinomonadaceae bacterium]|nr:hypothetical protein [Pyrinomonadaceae bacterium]
MKNMILSTAIAIGLTMILGAASTIDAQGRGGGRPAGAGPPAGAGNQGGGPPAGMPGVDRGLGTAAGRSEGRSTIGLGRASDNSGGRSDTGIDRAHRARHNADSINDNEINRYRGLAKRFGSTPEEMRALYQTALMTNPDLRFGNFVSAYVVADSLGGRFPNITAEAILLGYENGDSLGRTLQNLGMTKEQAKTAESNAKMSMRDARNRSGN